jgi:cytochrome c556
MLLYSLRGIEMKRLLLIAATAVVTTGAFAAAPDAAPPAPAPAAAPAAPPSPEAIAKSAIETRQGLFKVMGAQMGPIGGMLRNRVPFDAAVIARNAARMQTLSEIIPELFANDTRKFTATPSKALEGIWNSQADFKVKADDLGKAAAALVVAAKGTDQAATLKAAGAMGQACGKCHDNYRAK